MQQFHLLASSFKFLPALAVLPPSSSILPAANSASIQLSIMLLQGVAAFLVDLFTMFIIEQQVVVATIVQGEPRQPSLEFHHLALRSAFKHPKAATKGALDH